MPVTNTLAIVVAVAGGRDRKWKLVIIVNIETVQKVHNNQTVGEGRDAVNETPGKGDGGAEWQ